MHHCFLYSYRLDTLFLCISDFMNVKLRGKLEEYTISEKSDFDVTFELLIYSIFDLQF